ncbi:hypothetical protein ETH_00035445 [Eimeria tenella]|uniref:Uncharacterized protein n=1 Tax=Eimeria tenella TaxID=5802 RepID=U6KRS0_EIMTE|nr:hypothetical protein ETH_00035445 [Eimeria tenella]CDJ39613.1 hypothetical protein ETH_00035445 [Eimeria tenella]|eukprot:XP_013230368.1 hypothetical protein ETH_00035445 [Eimeria tenella]
MKRPMRTAATMPAAGFVCGQRQQQISRCRAPAELVFGPGGSPRAGV